MNSQTVQLPNYVDLVGESDEDFSTLFFDASEFEQRRGLEETHYWHLVRRKILLEQLRQVCRNPQARLIELGCGSGTVSTYLNQHGYSVDYGDIHREGLENSYVSAARRLGVSADKRRFMRIDITRQIPDQPYDGLLLFDVLEHLPDDKRVLMNLRNAYPTPRCGEEFLLFTVPAFQMLWSPWDDMQHHKRRYTLATARALAESSGFEVVRATYFFLPLFFAAGLVKLARQLRPTRQPPPDKLSDLVEARNHGWINALMQAVLGPESTWLRHANLPLGTSVLIAARPQ